MAPSFYSHASQLGHPLHHPEQRSPPEHPKHDSCALGSPRPALSNCVPGWPGALCVLPEGLGRDTFRARPFRRWGKVRLLASSWSLWRPPAERRLLRRHTLQPPTIPPPRPGTLAPLGRGASQRLERPRPTCDHRQEALAPPLLAATVAA